MSESPENKDEVSAYNTMMARVRETLRGDPLERALQNAREQAVEMGELSREEAERISDYVRRDIQDLGTYVSQTESELSGWLHMDITLIEAQLLDILSHVADISRVELGQWAPSPEGPPDYRTGEVTAPGILECRDCGEHLRFSHTARIPPCPKCHGTGFRRIKK